MPLRRRAATLTAVSATALLTLAAPAALAATRPAAGLTQDGGWRRPAPVVTGRPFAYRADTASARAPKTGGTDVRAVRRAGSVPRPRLDGLGPVRAAETTASAASASSSATPSPSTSASAPAKDKKKGGGSGFGNWLTAAVFFVASVGVGFLLSGRRRRQR
jgi:hypothetical protein